MWVSYALFKAWWDSWEFGKLRTQLLGLYVAMLPMWLFAGYCWGRWTWSWMERRKRAAAESAGGQE